jgi:RimJ/RimL family protein N-acetyltransferase
MTRSAAAPFPDELDVGSIVLRRRRASDVPELLDAIEASIEELGRFLSWAGSGTPTREDLLDDVATRDAAFEAGTGFEYVIRDAASGELIGQAGAGLRDDDSAALEVGYWVRTDRVGHGHATQSAAVLTTMAFRVLPAITRVEIRMDKGNERSRRVPERLGFELVGENVCEGERLPGQTGVEYIWVATRGWQRP